MFAYIVVKMRPWCVSWLRAGTSLDEQAAASGSSAAAAAHHAIAGRSRCGCAIAESGGCGLYGRWTSRVVADPEQRWDGEICREVVSGDRSGRCASYFVSSSSLRTPASRSSGHGAAGRGWWGSVKHMWPFPTFEKKNCSS
jgi:hypothetical protein